VSVQEAGKGGEDSPLAHGCKSPSLCPSWDPVSCNQRRPGLDMQEPNDWKQLWGVTEVCVYQCVCVCMRDTSHTTHTNSVCWYINISVWC